MKSDDTSHLPTSDFWILLMEAADLACHSSGRNSPASCRGLSKIGRIAVVNESPEHFPTTVSRKYSIS